MAIENKFVTDGYVKASLDEYFAKQLNRAGYGGMEINRTPMGTQITIYAEKPGMVIGKGGKVIRKLTRDVDKLYNMDNPQIDAQEVKTPELNAQMMATRLAASIERGWYFRKAGHNAIRAIMGAGALGCEIIMSGKLTGPRARVEKLVRGYIKHAGKPVDDIVDEGFATAVKKLGTIGCKVRIIHPDAVLPDTFKLEEVEPEEMEEEFEVVEEESEESGIQELVEEETTGEVAEAESETEEVAESSEETSVESEPESETGDVTESEVSEVENSQYEWEERREVNGVWQHKHEGHNYWHPMARIHREDK
ncbi:30S ribosomal protein S3 [Methanohalobium sp.]|uniref:30S ribosomal protein S3 n=1 Tax=Methanohalobium sp. TaxID=2837493 RepID=UPI0025D955BC|nr:30S ribosomal protein S3 [Methanohalobium sp.]